MLYNKIITKEQYDKEAFNKLVKPFPAEYVKEAPKGKFKICISQQIR